MPSLRTDDQLECLGINLLNKVLSVPLYPDEPDPRTHFLLLFEVTGALDGPYVPTSNDIVECVKRAGYPPGDIADLDGTLVAIDAKVASRAFISFTTKSLAYGVSIGDVKAASCVWSELTAWVGGHRRCFGNFGVDEKGGLDAWDPILREQTYVFDVMLMIASPKRVAVLMAFEDD